MFRTFRSPSNSFRSNSSRLPASPLSLSVISLTALLTAASISLGNVLTLFRNSVNSCSLSATAFSLCTNSLSICSFLNSISLSSFAFASSNPSFANCCSRSKAYVNSSFSLLRLFCSSVSCSLTRVSWSFFSLYQPMRIVSISFFNSSLLIAISDSNSSRFWFCDSISAANVAADLSISYISSSSFSLNSMASCMPLNLFTSSSSLSEI